MAAGCALCGLCRLFVFVLVFGSQTEPTRAAPGGVTICSCDLSPGNCDLNCCCDPDCTPGVFSSCLPGSTRAERWLCLPRWLMFRNNTPYPAAIVGAAPAQLFCVLSADASVNYVVAPRKVDAASFLPLGELYGGPSFCPPSQSAPGLSGFYRAGDPVLTISPSGAVGVLSQPAPTGLRNLCADNNPAKFLQGGSTSCLRLFSNLSASCETEPVLRAAHYSQGVAVLRVPADVSSQAANPVPVSSAVPLSPVLQGDQCHNVVSRVMYTVWYDASLGIVNVSADITLGSVSGAGLQQTFTISYKPVDAPAGGSVQIRSGNPGYLIGSPVRSDNGTLYALRSLGGESCGRAPVQFGMNALSGCGLRGTAQDSCSDFQTRAYQMLQAGDAPHSLARFGNITGSGQSGDWTRITYRNCSGQGDCSSGCPAPVSLEMQILWAKVGLLSNPQAQLLAARFTYTCRRVQCQDVTYLQAQVSFTDLSRRGPAPRSSPGVTDFFLPFRTSAALTSAGNLLLTVLLAGAHLIPAGPLS